MSDPVRNEEFVRLFANNHRRLFVYIMAFVHDRAAAEDIFQETSLILWQQFDKFRLDCPFMPWAAGIAFNQIRKFRRKRSNDRLVFSEALLEDLARDAAEFLPELDARQAALGRCLESLSERNRQLISSFYGTKATAGDVAREWGCSVHAVYKALKTVRRRLYDCVNQQLLGNEP